MLKKKNAHKQNKNNLRHVIWNNSALISINDFKVREQIRNHEEDIMNKIKIKLSCN